MPYFMHAGKSTGATGMRGNGEGSSQPIKTVLNDAYLDMHILKNDAYSLECNAREDLYDYPTNPGVSGTRWVMMSVYPYTKM